MLRGVLGAVAFLTRWPVPRAGTRAAEELHRVALWFPAAGALLALPCGALAAWAPAAFPPLLTASLCVTWLALASGGLHLDGLSDTFDALGGGRGDRVRMLAILRDSRAGPHGVAAITCVLLVKASALAAFVEAAPALLVLGPAAARAATVPLLAYGRSARPGGVGAALHERTGGGDVAGAFVLLAAIGVACGAAAGAAIPALRATAAALGAAPLLAWLVARRLGGLTGDVHGAAIEVAECAFAVVAVGGCA